MKKRLFLSLFVLTCTAVFLPAAGKKEKYIPAFPGIPANNLVLNPSFENDLQGWESLWTRDKNAGNARIISEKDIDGKRALEITHKGSQDWAIGQVRRVAVKPGEVYEISAVAYCETISGSLEISVVTRNKDNSELSWMYGSSRTEKFGTYVPLHSRFMIPDMCTNIQFRISGWGPVKAKIDRIILSKIRDAAGPVSFDKDTYSITNGGTKICFFPASAGFTFTVSETETIYNLEGLGDGLMLTGFSRDETSFSFDFYNADGETIKASFNVSRDGSVGIEISSNGIQSGKTGFPGIFRAGVNDSWVIPQNEGLLIPAMDEHYRPWDLQLFQGHGGLSMPFIGLTDGERGMLVTAETADDAIVKFYPPDLKNNLASGFAFFWLPQKGKWGYARKLKLFFTGQNGYTGIAKKYREIVKAQGRLVTLAEKEKQIPELDRLAGAANIWWWQKAEWWQDDPEGWKAAAELKAAGITKALWSNSNTEQEISEINKLGYLSGKYDIYQDVWSPKAPINYGSREGWPEDLILLPDGTPMKGWVAKQDGKEYPGGVICSFRGFERLKKRVADVLKKKSYLSRFIDTTTASPLRECWDPDHPMTRSEDRQNKQKMLGWLGNQFGLVTGSETGIDWAVPYVHYFEGMMSIGPYRFDDAGYDLVTYKPPTEEMLRFQVGPRYRIPLFELVYHDCVVSFWYWGDSSNRLPEIWRDRDLFNLLYGTGPLYILDRKRWERDREQIIESYKTATLSSGRTAYSEMLAHGFLNSDHTVQYSEFADGSRIWVNFGDTEFKTKEGIALEPKGYHFAEGGQDG